MKKIFLLGILSLALSQITNAQSMGSDYQTAIGIKFYPTALSVKHFIAPNKAIEGLGYFYNDGTRVTGLYELHYDINGVEGLKWYIGPGAHIAFWNDDWKKNNPTRNSSLAIGVDGILGVDYKIKNAPLNISFDWQPSLNLIGYTYFEAGWGGLGVRYTF
ncbi:hypothetical protein ACFOW1_03010 [Parasediminibacterium paludis]|uniref:DUF3575 domain-containing protein n=1 Tax=Parasediminibacterium paludis TaxID=908966 RepID=A0ABV8PVR1_9BACT